MFLERVSSWGRACPSDCSLKETARVVGLERVSSWGHEREGEMVVMREDKTHKEEADKKIEDENGVDVPVHPLSGCLLCLLVR
jgi:hypothetical protein